VDEETETARAEGDLRLITALLRSGLHGFQRFLDLGQGTRCAMVFSAGTSPLSVSRVPDDDQVLALAVAAQAQMFVTGDRDLLDLEPYHGVAIVSPREFWDRQRFGSLDHAVLRLHP
jgi:hypothetical protein